MSALAASAVSLYPASRQVTYRGRDQRILSLRLKLVLTGQGGLTNTIGADALGFNELLDCSALVDTTNGKVYPAVVDPTLNIIILADGSAAPAPVDVTTTAAYITVHGFPKPAR